MKKDRIIAAILAIALGGFGLHKLYLRKISWLLYLIFSWTFIPALVGVIEGIWYLLMSDEEFDSKYNTITNK